MQGDSTVKRLKKTAADQDVLRGLVPVHKNMCQEFCPRGTSPKKEENDEKENDLCLARSFDDMRSRKDGIGRQCGY